jgi:phosphate/sulfate permease
MDWKIALNIIVVVFILPFLAGFFGGFMYNEYKRDKANYFDALPSPLACHADNSCSLKDVVN